MRTLEEIRGRCFITEDGHWLWRGSLRKDGRANIYAPDYTRADGDMRTQCGTRALYHCAYQQPVPEGHRVFGTCEEKACCNPEHVRCDTETAYGKFIARRGVLKNQSARILANRAIGRTRAKLTAEQALYVQTNPKLGKDLADELGVSTSTISKYRRMQNVVTAVGGAINPYAALMR